MLPGNALLQMLITGTIFPFMLYAMTIILYLAVRKRLERREGTFNLGRFEVPVATVALVWVLAVLCVLVASSNLWVTTAVVGGTLALGGIYLGYLIKFKRDIIESEPGKADIF